MNLLLILDLKKKQYLEYIRFFLNLMFQTCKSATGFLSIAINVTIKMRAYDVSYNLHYNNSSGIHLAILTPGPMVPSY